MINIQNLTDDATCYAVVREMRWPDGVRCPSCGSEVANKHGFLSRQPHRQRYECRECGQQFDDLSGTTLKNITGHCECGFYACI